MYCKSTRAQTGVLGSRRNAVCGVRGNFMEAKRSLMMACQNGMDQTMVLAVVLPLLADQLVWMT